MDDLAQLKESFPAAVRTYECFVRQLLQVAPITNPHEVAPASRLDQLIPAEQRRDAWVKLREAGFDLPELTLSPNMRFITSVLVVGPVLLLAVLLKSWLSLFAIARLARFAYNVTRPLAIFPAQCCASVRDAAMYLTHFKREDYRAGLWTRQDTAAKVRYIVATAAGVPFEAINDDTKFSDLY